MMCSAGTTRTRMGFEQIGAEVNALLLEEKDDTGAVQDGLFYSKINRLNNRKARRRGSPLGVSVTIAIGEVDRNTCAIDQNAVSEDLSADPALTGRTWKVEDQIVTTKIFDAGKIKDDVWAVFKETSQDEAFACCLLQQTLPYTWNRALSKNGLSQS